MPEIITIFNKYKDKYNYKNIFIFNDVISRIEKRKFVREITENETITLSMVKDNIELFLFGKELTILANPEVLNLEEFKYYNEKTLLKIMISVDNEKIIKNGYKILSKEYKNKYIDYKKYS